MADVQLIRFSRSGVTWEPTAGGNALTFTFSPKPSVIDKIPTTEWFIRKVGHKLEPSATNRKRQLIKFKVTGAMTVTNFTQEDGLQDILLDRSGAYAYAFVNDMEIPNYYDIVAVESANLRQSPKTLEGESWIVYTLNMTKIFHKPK